MAIDVGSILTGGIGAIGNLFQAHLNARQSRINTDKTIRANKAMADLQFQRDLEMWEKGNIYNAPEAQMERLRQAGLNPNMVYGSGSPAGQSAGQIPKYNAPNVQYEYQAPQFMGALASFQDMTLKQAQINNLKDQNKAIQARASMDDLLANLYTDNPELFKRLKLEFPVRKFETDYLLGNQKFQQQKEFWERVTSPAMTEGYQLSFMKERNQQIQKDILKKEAEIKLIDEKTTYQQKLNEWYLTKLFGDMGLKAVSQLFKLSPWSVGAKAGQSLFRSGKSFNRTTRDIQRGYYD